MEKEFEFEINRAHYDALIKWSVDHTFYRDLIIEYSQSDETEQRDFILSPEGNDIYYNLFWCHVYGIQEIDLALDNAMNAFDKYMFNAYPLFSDLEEVYDYESRCL